MDWNTASAREHFAELLSAANTEPQTVFNRDRPIAVVVSAALFAEFDRWREQQSRGSLATAFAGLRDLAAADGWELEVPRRTDRVSSKFGGEE